MRVVDLQLSFPAILVAMMILAFLARGIMNVCLRSSSSNGRPMPARRAARRCGAAQGIHRGREALARTLAAFVVHLLPNCLPPLIVIATVQIARAIALEATLSFLGLGVR